MRRRVYSADITIYFYLRFNNNVNKNIEYYYVNMEQNTDIIILTIAIKGDEISIIESIKESRTGYNPPEGALKITPGIDKSSIFKFIEKKSKENQDLYNATPARINDTTPDQNVGSTQTNARQPYTDYPVDVSYKEAKPDDYDDKDVMIYLSEIRRKNKGKVPDYLETLHDALYDAIKTNETNNKGPIIGKGWRGYTTDIGTGKYLFNKIKTIVDSRNQFMGVSYEKIKKGLDDAFENVYSKNVPNTYRDALKQMQGAVGSMSDFSYNNIPIFDKDHMNLNKYENMKKLTENLKRLDFERNKEKEPDGELYPPTLKKGCFKSKTRGDGFNPLNRTRKLNDCFKMWVDSDEKTVADFLKYISGKPDPEFESEPIISKYKFELDAAFEKVYSKDTNIPPKTYSDALNQMQVAIGSMSAFSYNNIPIFDKEHMKSNKYENMQKLTENLNQLEFKMNTEKTQDGGLYPPTLQNKMWVDFDEKTVVDFLKYISGNPDPESESEPIIPKPTTAQ